MTDYQALIATAREAVQGTSPGPWTHFYPDQCCAGHCVTNDQGFGFHDQDHMVTHKDAHFVSTARQLVPALIDALAEATDELERLAQ